MARSETVIEAAEPGEWLSSTISLHLAAFDASGLVLAGLAADLRRNLPDAIAELRGYFLGLDLRLADPADQAQRLAAFATLNGTLINAGFIPRTLALVDWILAPSLRHLPDDYGTRQAGIAAYEVRFTARRDLRRPVLEPYWADPRYGLANRRTFAAFHDELDPASALFVRTLIEGTTKTRGGYFSLRNVGAPYGKAQVDAVADKLAADGWIANLGPSKYDPFNRECVRGPKAKALAAKDLLSR